MNNQTNSCFSQKKHLLHSTLYGALSIICFSPFIVSEAHAKGAVVSVTTSVEPATSLTYTQGGEAYQWGQGQNLLIESFDYLGGSYDFSRLASSVVIRRSDIPGVAEGRPCGLFAETTGTPNSYKADYPEDQFGDGNCDMAELMAGRVVNRGALDVFSNAGIRPKNIERIDFVFEHGIVAPLRTIRLSDTGHIATEKRGNNPIQMAAILSLDGAGKPDSYGPLVMIQGAGCADPTICYGETNVVTVNEFLHNNSVPPQGYVSKIGGAEEILGMAFVSLEDLGIAAGQKYFGFSYFPRDVVDGAHDLLDPTTFPTTTADFNKGDGADIYGGTSGYFILSDVKNLTGTVYLDDNDNGALDAGEAGLSGIAVTLFEDTNANGVFDAGTDAQLGAVSDSGPSGTYLYSGMDSGTYFVVVDSLDPDLPPGVTTTNDSVTVVVTGDDVAGVDFPFKASVALAPIANDDAVATLQDTPVVIDVLANDEDIRGGGLAVAIVESPDNGTGLVNENQIVYSPGGAFSGNDALIYEITDSGGVKARATVRVAVVSTVDTDGDGVINSDDIDDDNDGILDVVEGSEDQDGDNIPNELDLDSDNDGIHDFEESGVSDLRQTTLDTNNDGRIDAVQNFGANGLADNLETAPESGLPDYDGDNQPDSPTDVDHDLKLDIHDLDTDGDALSDVIEAGLADSDTNSKVDEFRDLNGDGYDDKTMFELQRRPLPDMDSNGVPDYRQCNCGSPITGLKGTGAGGVSAWLLVILGVLLVARLCLKRNTKTKWSGHV